MGWLVGFSLYSGTSHKSAVIEPVLRKLRFSHADGSLLVMSANNDDRDSMRKWELAQDELVAFNSVASSAGSTATMAVLVQSATGHLNGWPSYPFDQEECHARATVAATRSQRTGSHSFGCGDHGGVGSLSTGSPSGRSSGRNTPT